MNSGAGSNWSDEYFIKTEAPAGYRLVSAKFIIFGDHPCSGEDTHPGAGSWARCRQVSRDDHTVVWVT